MLARAHKVLDLGVRGGKSVRGWLARVYAHPYNRQHPVGAVVRLGKWHLLRLSRRPWDLAFWNERRTIRCYPDADGSMWLVLNVIMDWPEFHFMQHYFRPGDTFLDIGANIGIYTLWASQFVEPAGRVVAFEPDPRNLARLREQLSLNELRWVEVASIALADRHGEARFSQGKDMLNHLMTDDATVPCISVPMTTLDAFCAEHEIGRVSFAKIDVEGVEQLVLAGAQRMLSERRIDVLQLEINHQAAERGLDGRVTIGLLAECGYELYRFDVATRALERVERVDWNGHENVLAIHDVERARSRVLVE